MLTPNLGSTRRSGSVGYQVSGEPQSGHSDRVTVSGEGKPIPNRDR
jgi:hypothetical protein